MFSASSPILTRCEAASASGPAHGAWWLGSLALLLAVSLPLPRPVRAEVGPPDVFARVAQAQAEVELIRASLGSPEVQPLGLEVTGAAPREVHLQALTLFAKADQLSFEQARQRGSSPSVQTAGSLADVLSVVDAAMGRLAIVKQHRGIREVSVLAQRDPSRTPTDVFLLLVATNRQLNQLLARPFEPRDVFAQVTMALGYAARLLSRYEGAVRLPDPPAHEPDKTPADVFGRLAGCFAEVVAIAEALGHRPLTLDVSGVERSRIAPNDVYDIASLTLSELVFLHGQVEGLTPPLDSYDPGPKTPSDVLQRAGILQAQLRDLRRLALDSPGRLRSGEAP